MGFEMHWPSFLDQQVSFAPVRNPIASESTETQEPGITAEQTRGGHVYGYRVGEPYTVWRFGFVLSDTERAELVDFVLAVGGAEFEFAEDALCGSVIVPTAVRIAPGSHRLEFQRIGKGRYEVSVELASVPGGS